MARKDVSSLGLSSEITSTFSEIKELLELHRHMKSQETTDL